MQSLMLFNSVSVRFIHSCFNENIFILLTNASFLLLRLLLPPGGFLLMAPIGDILMDQIRLLHSREFINNNLIILFGDTVTVLHLTKCNLQAQKCELCQPNA